MLTDMLSDLNVVYLDTKYKNPGDFMANAFANYYILFGQQISWNPTIKIMDSLGAFMSYTFSMSSAISSEP